MNRRYIRLVNVSGRARTCFLECAGMHKDSHKMSKMTILRIPGNLKFVFMCVGKESCRIYAKNTTTTIQSFISSIEKRYREISRIMKVAVINPTVAYGQSLINVLAKSGLDVVVLVENRKDAKAISSNSSKYSNVDVQITDSFFGATAELIRILQGCSRVFIMHVYLDKFETKLEEQQALTIFNACAKANVKEVVFTTLEANLNHTSGAKSQIVSIYNAAGGMGNTSYSFEQMKNAKQYAERLEVNLTHMFLSCTETPKLIATSLVQEHDGKNRVKFYQADANWRKQIA